MWKSHEKYTPYEGMSEKNKVIADAIRRRAATHDNVFDGALMYCFNGMMWHEDFIVGTKVIDSEDVIETMDKKALDAAVKKIERLKSRSLYTSIRLQKSVALNRKRHEKSKTIKLFC